MATNSELFIPDDDKLIYEALYNESVRRWNAARSKDICGTKNKTIRANLRAQSDRLMLLAMKRKGN